MIFIRIAAIIYRMYEDRGIGIPHFRAIITIVVILFLHLIHVGLLFNISPKWLMPWNTYEGKSFQWVFVFLYFGVLITIISLVFSKGKLDKIEVSEKQMYKARTIVPIYLVICILLLTALLVKSGVEKGVINL